MKEAPREKPVMPEPWMSGMVRCVEGDGMVHLMQTGPWPGMIVLFVFFLSALLIGLAYRLEVPVPVRWAMGIGFYGIGPLIVVRAYQWRREGPVVSYDPARREISIPRMGMVIPPGSASRLRMGSVRIVDGEGGETGAKSLEYVAGPGDKPVLVYIFSGRKSVEEWTRFRESIIGRETAVPTEPAA